MAGRKDDRWLNTRRGAVPCAVCGKPVSEAAHIHYGGDGGTGIKVDDIYTVPLCSYHHAVYDGRTGTIEQRLALASEIIRRFCELEYVTYGFATETETDRTQLARNWLLQDQTG